MLVLPGSSFRWAEESFPRLEALPIMLHRLALRYEGVKSYSALQMRTMRRPGAFQKLT